MSVDLLARVLPRPTAAAESRGSWQHVEFSLGIDLPSDYKSFIANYGSGAISDFITVLNPFSNNENINLLVQADRQFQALEVLKREFSETYRFLTSAVPGGLLPVAMTDNGDVVYWYLKGKQDDWTIIVNDSRGPEFEEFDFNLTTFLAHLLENKLCPRAFPSAWRRGAPTFTSF